MHLIFKFTNGKTRENFVILVKIKLEISNLLFKYQFTSFIKRKEFIELITLKLLTVYSRSVSHGIYPINSMGNIPKIYFFIELFPPEVIFQ